MANVEGRLKEIGRTLTSIDNRLNHLNSRIDTRLNYLSPRIDTWLRWTLGTLLTMWITIILAILLT